jgi:expansin (peptidoglycan-binding protein)
MRSPFRGSLLLPVALDDERSLLAFAVVALSACGSSAAPSVDKSHGALAASIRLGQTEQGVATYYAATGAGACSFDPTPNDLDVAAMDATEYAGSAACGTCVEATGPKGTVTLRIVDECPECEKGHLDLGKEAFAKIADVSAGKVSIAWSTVSCNVSGPVQYHFKDGSSQYWTAIQVRNHRLPIAKLEAKKPSGELIELARQDYNYFVADKGVGSAGFSVRITSTTGEVLEDSLPAPTSDTTVAGTKQFSPP